MKPHNGQQEITDFVAVYGIIVGNPSFSLEPAAMSRTKSDMPRKLFSISLPEDLRAIVDAEAQQADRSVSAQMRIIVTEWSKAKGLLTDHPPKPKRPPRAP